MPSPILVTGGTGTLGRRVTERLIAAGHRVRVLSRSPHDSTPDVEFVVGDLETGAGTDAAFVGIETVIHCAGSAKGDAEKAEGLVASAKRAGTVRHIVYISVVGADRIPVVTRTDRNMFGYFEAKRAAEVIIEESGIPFTILRATQFHTLVLLVVEAMVKLPVIPMPKSLRVQPVDAAEVADRLVHLATAPPAGLVSDLAGPRIYGSHELLRGYLKSVGKRRGILSIGLPGKAAKAMLGGANLSPEHADGTRTWEEFLASAVARD